MKPRPYQIFLVLLVITSILGTLTWGVARGYRYLIQRNIAYSMRLGLLQSSLDTTAGQLRLTTEKNRELTETVRILEDRNMSTNLALTSERARNDYIDSQVKQISGTISTLQKLHSLDRELLEKYSKVYFLNENYIPKSLAEIDGKFVWSKDQKAQFQTGAIKYLQGMLESATASGLTLKITSAYRSFEEQAVIKSNHRMLYGSGANQFSADQGYSEHQLGTTVDVSDRAVGGLTESFEKTKNYTWLSQNAYRFGFILSYPRGNTYYQFEPWHWRFVGVTLSTKLHDDKKNFYDLSQREIDAHLINIFD